VPGVACLLLGVALALSACGFQPLYGRPGAQARSSVDHMAAIRISPLADRVGQQMHNLLRDRLNPRGRPRDPAYRLDVEIREVRRELGIRKDETATRANLILSADFTLRELGSDLVLLKGRTSSVNSFNILTNQFATTFAESDARERALRELSDNIRVRLGIYFSDNPKSAS
jgi:LPS-assembly lipoprotein